jgi:hypothetical protein
VRTYTTSDDSDSEWSAPTTDASFSSSITSQSQTLTETQNLSQESGAGVSDHADASQWEQQLHTMFPANTPMQIRAAVASATRAGNFEAGVDYLIKGQYVDC